MKKRGKPRKRKKDENIWNVPNTLTLLRVIITFVTVYFIFAGYGVVTIVVLFAIGMLTDFFDGQIARRFNLTTKFGAKFDVVADRFLMGGVALAFIINYGLAGLLTRYHILQMLMIMTRELIALPVAIIALTSGKGIPNVRWIGKITTALQGFTFPAVVLSITYPIFNFSIYLSFITAIVGVVAGMTFIGDVIRREEK